jgi:hypothetical protein
VPSHFQHRIGILVPSTSATWRLSLNDGIVILLRQALELLVQKDEWISRHGLAERLLHFAVLKRDHSSAS